MAYDLVVFLRFWNEALFSLPVLQSEDQVYLGLYLIPYYFTHHLNQQILRTYLLPARCCAGLHNIEFCSRDMQNQDGLRYNRVMSTAKGRARSTRAKGKQEGLPLSGQRRLHRGVIAELT